MFFIFSIHTVGPGIVQGILQKIFAADVGKIKKTEAVLEQGELRPFSLSQGAPQINEISDKPAGNHGKDLTSFAKQPNKKRHHRADQDTGGDRKIKLEVLAANDDISRKAAETQLSHPGPKQPRQQKDNPQSNENPLCHVLSSPSAGNRRTVLSGSFCLLRLYFKWTSGFWIFENGSLFSGIILGSGRHLKCQCVIPREAVTRNLAPNQE